MSKYLIAALALSTTAIAAPAMAQDSAAPFNGAHAEVIGGWDRVQGEGSHDDGVLYGVGAGYDFRKASVQVMTSATAMPCSASKAKPAIRPRSRMSAA